MTKKRELLGGQMRIWRGLGLKRKEVLPKPKEKKAKGRGGCNRDA